MAPSRSSDDGAHPGGGGGGSPFPETHPLALLQVLERGKGSGGTFLENLYFLVKNLSAVLSVQGDYIGESFSLDVSTCGPVIYGLIVHLSNWAFEELRSRFVRMISPGKVVPLAETTSAQFHVDQCVSSSCLQDFCRLLRCCIIMLHLLEFDLYLSMQKSQILVEMLRELCSPDVATLFPQQGVVKDRPVTVVEAGFECFPEESSPSSPSLCSILEVFVDELLVHQNLRKHFTMTYYISSASEKLPAHDCATCDIGIILELVSAHFLLSSHEETAFERPFHLNVCCKLMDTESTKLSLTAALALLGTPAIFSAPYMLQSHVILLVSKCVASSRDLDWTAMNCYLSAFEQSVILYACHLSHFPLYHDVTGANCQSRSFVAEHCIMEKDFGVSFDFHVRKVTFDAVDSHSQKLIDHCCKQSCSFLSTTNAETITTCMTYIKENKHAIQEQWREETCLILNCMVQKIAGETGKGPSQINEEINWQEIYYGAALLKLMGSSLLQIVSVLSEYATKSLNDNNLCRDYELVLGIINFFKDHSVGQYVLCDTQAAYSSKQQQTSLMLAHFTSLLFYSIDRRLYPLWEGCIFVMIAAMNLLAFEEGNLNTVRTMYGYVREISNSQGLSRRRSSIRIASGFQKVQLLQSKRMTTYLYKTSRMDVGASQIEGRDGPSRSSPHVPPGDVDYDLSSEGNGSCNGEAFLKCVLEDHSIPDWDDLANFIESTPGKDYSRWLRKRESYNKWKNKKLAVSRHQRKKMLRRMITKCCIE